MIKKVSESYRKHPFAFFFGPLLKAIEAFFDLLIPLIMKAVIDLSKYDSPNDIPNNISKGLGTFIRSFGVWVKSNPSLNDAIIGGVIILILGVVGFVVTMITQYIAARTSMIVSTEIRDSLFKKILSLSKFEREQIGKNRLLTVLNADSYQVQNGVLYFIRLIIRCPIIILGAIIVSFVLDYRIGFVFLATVPLIAIIIFVVMRKSSKGYLEIQDQLDVLSNTTSDDLEGAKDIRAFNSQNHEIDKFQEQTKTYENKAIKVGKLNALINPLTYALVSIATIAVVILGVSNIFDSSEAEQVLVISTIIASVSYLAQIFFTTVQLTNVVMILTKAGASRKRINDVLKINPSIFDDENGQKKQIKDGEEIFSFNNVYLSYKENGNYALSDINFKLIKGQSLGIIGGTGSGKSSIISLMERFMDVSKGEIKYKGINIKQYRLSSLRNEIALVPQKSSLFQGSIKSNMLMANSNASIENINSALKVAQAYDFVYEKENNLDYLIEEGGKNLSGGQRQRLSIARGLLKRSEILILDDSLSAVDLLTDKQIRSSISNNYKDLTKVIISQRVASVMDLDQIIVMDAGKIMAIGKHEDLLKTCPIYKEIYDTQIANGGSK